MNVMMQGQNSAQQMQENLRNSMTSGNAQGLMPGQSRGSLNERDLLLQQQQLLRSSGLRGRFVGAKEAASWAHALVPAAGAARC